MEGDSRVCNEKKQKHCERNHKFFVCDFACHGFTIMKKRVLSIHLSSSGQMDDGNDVKPKSDLNC
jgi:hypothetical protein